MSQLVAYHSLVVTYKTMVSLQPRYLHDKFGTQFPFNTRLAASRQIRIDANFDAELSLAHTSFRWRASRFYTGLPTRIRSETKLARIKFHLKQWVRDNIDI